MYTDASGKLVQQVDTLFKAVNDNVTTVHVSHLQYKTYLSRVTLVTCQTRYFLPILLPTLQQHLQQ